MTRDAWRDLARAFIRWAPRSDSEAFTFLVYRSIINAYTKAFGLALLTTMPTEIEAMVEQVRELLHSTLS